MESKFDIDIFTIPGEHDLQKTGESLQNAINALRSQARYAILESLTDICFPAPQSTEIKLSEWPKGRIFAPAFELRWEKTGAAYRAVLAKEDGFEPPEEVSACLPEKNLEIAKTFWGKYETQFIYLWAENDPRLGRPLRYECLDAEPTKNKENVQLETRLYYDAHGRLIFWRYLNMRWTL
ncbi:MAG: hypothetical protein HUU32_16940 [Calditrichaceae bacterium]|nr:hypothetical protein [Calditrichia bacterium]NUQ43078.1 hypothetical protein [Calditrichaceae bacterium]